MNLQNLKPIVKKLFIAKFEMSQGFDDLLSWEEVKETDFITEIIDHNGQVEIKFSDSFTPFGQRDQSLRNNCSGSINLIGEYAYPSHYSKNPMGPRENSLFYDTNIETFVNDVMNAVVERYDEWSLNVSTLEVFYAFGEYNLIKYLKARIDKIWSFSPKSVNETATEDLIQLRELAMKELLNSIQSDLLSEKLRDTIEQFKSDAYLKDLQTEFETKIRPFKEIQTRIDVNKIGLNWPRGNK